jgi:anti-anti-sigma factor
MEPSRIEYMYRGDILVLNFLTERFELREAKMLEDMIFEKLTERNEKVVLNLSNTDYINSTAVSVLVRIAAEKRLRLSDLKPEVISILDTIGIFELLKTYPSVRDACIAFEKEET